MKLNKKRTIFVGFAFMSICAFWQVYEGIVPLILKNTFDLNDAVSGVIMAMDNILALFMLPLFGFLSDKTNTRFGKRTPYIFFGTIAACAFMLILPLGDKYRSLPLFVTGLGLVLVSMSTYRSPAVALMPDVTPKPLRSKGNAIINLMGACGGILMLGATALLVAKVPHPNYIPLFGTVALFMLACLGVFLFSTKENDLTAMMKKESALLGEETEAEAEVAAPMSKDVKKSLYLILLSVFLWYMGYNAVTTAFSKYASVHWGLEGGTYAYTLIIAQAAAIATYIPAGLIATRIGRRKTILGGVAMLSVAFAFCVFYKSFSGMIFFFFILAGAGWATINVNSYPMAVEMSRGSDVGKYTGYYYTASQSAQIITPILSGAVLEYGYRFLGSADPNAGYVLLFPYGALFVAFSFLTMLGVRHGDAKTETRETLLESFDVGD